MDILDNDKEKDKTDNVPITNISQCGCINPENCSKLETFDWLSSIPESTRKIDLVEVRFKNTRKEFFINSNALRLKKGDIVAVEASPGHDIGIVSLTGELVHLQMKKQGVSVKGQEFKKIYRKAKSADLEKWYDAVMLEHTTMLKTRKIAADLKLDMKIGDVEYQGDRTKAIFYYIADERVDFRELIKILAETFKVRIEMRQIGARQEAGRIGGIGSCGRELCCSTWITNFVSVTTNAARYQEISLNPQKLAGQCGKLKCCLNYELDCYIDAQKDFPSTEIVLETQKGPAYHNKTDIFRRIMWYSFDAENIVNITPVPVDRVKEVIALNKKGQKVDTLIDLTVIDEAVLDYKNEVGQESLTRFDDQKSKRKKRKGNKSSNKRKRPRNDKRQQK
ncbi:MAG: regulatory iron-sulfur-containing complex subunit RicT [Bacteroidales bacterium]